jgi:Protein of unknown function (DUF3570)
MRVRTLASMLAPFLILAFAGSVFGADGLARKKTRSPHRSRVVDDEDQTPPPADSAPSEEKGGVATKASFESSGYLDSDHVYVGSPSLGGSIGDELAGWSIGGHYLVDVVSAASVDIVSTASHHWVEVRHAGSADGSIKWGDAEVSASGSVSREPDYLSLTGSGNITLDLLEKNVTPFLGFSYGSDDVGKTGMPHELWKNKTTLSGRLGSTFVVDRSTIASVQLDAIDESGYLAKPYRYIPLFAPGQVGSIRAGASVDEVNAARVDQRPIEQLPERRNRFAFTGRIAHRYSAATIRLDERIYMDSWGVRASTSDLRYVFDIGQAWMIWPHLRFHVQTGASFWQRGYELIPGTGGSFTVPELRTGDRELSPLYTATLGFGVRFRFIDDLRKPWFLVFEGDYGYTKYSDAIYISERKALFSTLAIEAAF